MIVEIPQSSAVRFEPVGASAATVLCADGIFKGAHGLEGLLNADAFWEQQPYGTRLHYGEGTQDMDGNKFHRILDLLPSPCGALPDARD